MKKVYISPVTDRVRFDNGSDVMQHFTGLNDASNAGHPGAAPTRSSSVNGKVKAF